MTEQEKALELFQGGASVNQVAKKMGIAWAKAKHLRDGGGALARSEAAPAESEDWDLKITVPGNRLDAILGACTEMEKATAVQSVLQCRLDALLA